MEIRLYWGILLYIHVLYVHARMYLLLLVVFEYLDLRFK